MKYNNYNEYVEKYTQYYNNEFKLMDHSASS